MNQCRLLRSYRVHLCERLVLQPTGNLFSDPPLPVVLEVSRGDNMSVAPNLLFEIDGSSFRRHYHIPLPY